MGVKVFIPPIDLGDMALPVHTQGNLLETAFQSFIYSVY